MADDKVTIKFQGGPMDGDVRTLPKGHIPQTVECLSGFDSGNKPQLGNYELRYVFVESEETP